jgi:flagellar motor switch protein FliG
MPQDVDIIVPVPTSLTQDMSARAKAAIVIALCYVNGNGMEEVSEFILSGLSRRMAETIHEETEDRSAVKTKEGEAAVTALVPGIQGQISAGEIRFVDLDDD